MIMIKVKLPGGYDYDDDEDYDDGDDYDDDDNFDDVRDHRMEMNDHFSSYSRSSICSELLQDMERRYM